MASDVEYNDSDEERKARANGWVPLAQWKGDPAKHVSARDFNERAETYLPAVKSLLSKVQQDYQRDKADLKARLERQEAEFKRRQRATEAMAQDALARQHQQHLAQLEAEKLQYVPPEQRPGYMQVIEKQNKFYEDVAKSTAATNDTASNTPPAERQQNTPNPEVQEWAARTPWINNPTLFAYAHALGDKLARENPNMPVREQLAYVEREVARKYPDVMSVYGIDAPRDDTVNHQDARHEDDTSNDGNSNYAQQRSNRAPAVEGGSSRTTSSNKQKGWRDISRPEQEAAYNNFIKQGLYGKDEAKAKEAYAASYWKHYGE